MSDCFDLTGGVGNGPALSAALQAQASAAEAQAALAQAQQIALLTPSALASLFAAMKAQGLFAGFVGVEAG